MTLILLFKDFVSAQLRQYVNQSECRGVLGPVHLLCICFCFDLTQLSRIIKPHKLTCSRQRKAKRICEKTVAFPSKSWRTKFSNLSQLHI